MWAPRFLRSRAGSTTESSDGWLTARTSRERPTDRKSVYQSPRSVLDFRSLDTAEVGRRASNFRVHRITTKV